MYMYGWLVIGCKPIAFDIGVDGVVPTTTLSHSSFDRVTIHLANLPDRSANSLKSFITWFYVPNLGVPADKG
jgi:hypothetical protein